MNNLGLSSSSLISIEPEILRAQLKLVQMDIWTLLKENLANSKSKEYMKSMKMMKRKENGESNSLKTLPKRLESKMNERTTSRVNKKT
jgi:hypothetical protein